ncbi:MAG: hypothetical protein JWQ42_277 [Edaphobacter sp.]|nr:hypothetical protein [Edaphobacter sp.]
MSDTTTAKSINPNTTVKMMKEKFSHIQNGD